MPSKKRSLASEFNARQQMVSGAYEIFYYHDDALPRVRLHSHSHYEFYFFLEGEVCYQIGGGASYDLSPGDFLLLPPGLRHGPAPSERVSRSASTPYRRIVLWLHPDFYRTLCEHSADFSYGYDLALARRQYHFHPDFITAGELQGRLLTLIEETRSDYVFHESTGALAAASLLLYVNRLAASLSRQTEAEPQETPLYLRLCSYINTHLTDRLSLDDLATQFYTSKYHISHVFKENMGIGLHAYLTGKRLQAVKNGMLSGIPLTQLVRDYGFEDYTSFYRAFKKEYGLSPKEFRQQHNTMESYREP